MQSISSITILGGGTAGWMTAAALASRLGTDNLKITLVESDRIGTVGVGEATIPHIRYFNSALGINEKEFMRATQATFKLGIKFENWKSDNHSYFHPFGTFGKSNSNVDFHHLYLAGKRNNCSKIISNYSLPCLAAEQGKFCHPDNTKGEPNNFSYAYHLDASLYAAYLRKYSEDKGVVRIEGEVVNATKNATNNMESLTLKGGQELKSDFYIDCSGFSSKLLGETYGIKFESWKDSLICDRAIVLPTVNGDELSKPYTTSKALSAGWKWNIPLRQRTGNGYVHSSAHISEDQAVSELTKELGNADASLAKTIRFEAGVRQQFWKKNCVAIGLSGGFLEPLESTSIYLIQAAITKFIELFPSKENNFERRKEFNRSLKHEYEVVKDFLILHYTENQHANKPFWKDYRNLPTPSSLKSRISLFKESGEFADYEHGIFMQPSWLAVFLGLELNVKHRPLTLINASPSQIAKNLESVELEILATLKKMPYQKDYLAQSNTSTQPIGRPNLYGHTG